MERQVEPTFVVAVPQQFREFAGTLEITERARFILACNRIWVDDSTTMLVHPMSPENVYSRMKDILGSEVYRSVGKNRRSATDDEYAKRSATRRRINELQGAIILQDYPSSPPDVSLADIVVPMQQQDSSVEDGALQPKVITDTTTDTTTDTVTDTTTTTTDTTTTGPTTSRSSTTTTTTTTTTCTTTTTTTTTTTEDQASRECSDEDPIATLVSKLERTS
jgi:hypothetical protein